MRMKFRAYAFGWPLLFRGGFPKLLYKHEETRRIDKLEYDNQGQLRVRATVTHEQARRCGAFSIGAKVLTYELRNTDSAPRSSPSSSTVKASCAPRSRSWTMRSSSISSCRHQRTGDHPASTLSQTDRDIERTASEPDRLPILQEATGPAARVRTKSRGWPKQRRDPALLSS